MTTIDEMPTEKIKELIHKIWSQLLKKAEIKATFSVAHLDGDVFTILTKDYTVPVDVYGFLLCDLKNYLEREFIPYYPTKKMTVSFNFYLVLAILNFISSAWNFMLVDLYFGFFSFIVGELCLYWCFKIRQDK